MQMPEMDGFETAELMRSNPRTRQLPIIFVTAGMKEDRHLFKGYQLGGVDYLMKPIEPAILRGKVQVFCDLYRQRLELTRVQNELAQQNARLRETYRELERETEKRLKTAEELRQKDQMMIQQSRLAAMGEMLNNIAHQWRQPLNVLGLKVQEIGLGFEHGICTKEFVDGNIAKCMEVVRHLSQTIDDFRDFSSPDREKTVFDVGEAAARTLSLVEESFRYRGIEVRLSIDGKPSITGYPNEYRQVLLNVLMNAKDAFGDQPAAGAAIEVKIFTENGRSVVTVTDNAGGIPDGIIGKVFDAYFTTKELGKGTGIGLFIAKNIIEKGMGGTLTAANVEGGAQFRIEV
ncbi:ATP-binding protein [Geomonas sp. Red32]|nr:ATP-binding protein [Geomonas sp. Red32]